MLLVPAAPSIHTKYGIRNLQYLYQGTQLPSTYRGRIETWPTTEPHHKAATENIFAAR